MGDKYGCFASIPNLAARVIKSPALFFREMPKTGGYLGPLIFMTAMGVASGVIGGLLHAIVNILGFQLYSGLALGMISLVLMPVYCAIGCAVSGFIVAALLFVIWRLMGSKETYEAAYRCTAYLAAISPIVTAVWIIPYAGGAVGLLIALYYLVTASTEAHRIPSGRAWMVFGIIAAFMMVISISAKMAAMRFARNMEQADESWRDASREMEKAAEEIRRQMKKEMETPNPPERTAE